MNTAVTLSETYLYKIRSLSNLLDKVFDRVLRKHAGITLSQCMVLIAIAQHGSLNQRAIARYLMISAAAVNRQIDIAKRKGWVRVVVSDSRGEGLQLTSHGARIMQQGLSALEQYVFRIFDEHNRSANLMQHIDLLLVGATEVLTEHTNTAKRTQVNITEKDTNYGNSQSSRTVQG